MPAVQVQLRHTVMEMIQHNWANMPGVPVILTEKRIPWEEIKLMPGVCMICTVMCGSGARIGIIAITMITHQAQIHRDLIRAPTM